MTFRNFKFDDTFSSRIAYDVTLQPTPSTAVERSCLVQEMVLILLLPMPTTALVAYAWIVKHMDISRNWKPHHGPVRSVTLYWINPHAMVYGILGQLALVALLVHSIVMWLCGWIK